MRKVGWRAATRLVLTAALTIAPFAAARQAQAAERPMSASCGSVVTTEYVFFPDISTTTPVASLKLLSGGCAYLWMWSWFTAGHSGWNVGLTTCPGGDPGGEPNSYTVYPVTNGGGAVSDGCVSPYGWTNSSQQEFYGPSAGLGCEFAAVQLIYDNDDVSSSTQPYCSV